MKHHLSIDIETRSSVDIGKAGAYKYAQSPDFEILLFAYQMDEEEVQLIDLAQGETFRKRCVLPCRMNRLSSMLTMRLSNGTA